MVKVFSLTELFRQQAQEGLDLSEKIVVPTHGELTLLRAKRVISPKISEALLAFFAKHPKPFSLHHRGVYAFAGKGGNILWTRPPTHYSMMGWGLLLANDQGEQLVVSVWGEWLPASMPPDKQSELLKFVTDSVIEIVAD